MTSLIQKVNRDNLIGSAIRHLDTGKAWPAHLTEALVAAGVTRTEIELRLKERAVVITWISMMGGLVALVQGLVGATIAIWLYTGILVALRRRRIHIHPYRLSTVGAIFMSVASWSVRSAIGDAQPAQHWMACLLTCSCVVALILQYRRFASTKVLEGITIS